VLGTRLDQETVDSLVDWVKNCSDRSQVCYTPLIHKMTFDFIVNTRVGLGTATDDKSKVTCQECLELIHA
jgi:hypothetical protein